MAQSADFCLNKAEECERKAQEADDKDVRRVLLAMREFLDQRSQTVGIGDRRWRGGWIGVRERQLSEGRGRA